MHFWKPPHPQQKQDTEEELLRGLSAAQDAQGVSGHNAEAGSRALSVSPDYIDALVAAVREPSVGE